MTEKHLETSDDRDQNLTEDDIERVAAAAATSFSVMGDAVGAINAAIAKATEQIELIAQAREEPPTEEEIAPWLVDPFEWSYTPPLAVWIVLEDRIPNLRSMVDIGHYWNLLDRALEKLESIGVITYPDSPGDE